MDRRQFLAGAAALGVSAVWASRTTASPSRTAWREDRKLFPQGVASGDPDDHSIMLWTRRPFDQGDRHELTVEVARDPDFRRVVATAKAPVLAAADWTCRTLVGGLQPATVYWYRFIDESGAGSRIGRTLTAPRASDARPVRFAFVSCNTINEGAQNAYARMIWEDERAPADRKLGFVLHLGDFIYEVVQYPDEVKTRYARTIYDIGKVPDARKIGNFHVPTTLAGYRQIYQAHINDPDIQDARAHFPWVCIGDNHEFSWQGWQSFTKFAGKVEPAQQLRVVANQAWWEYIPSRVRKASGDGLEQFSPPAVSNAPIETFDAQGFATEPNSVTAIASMTAYRALRYGKHVDLILTDLHSYKASDPTDRPEAAALDSGEFPVLPQEWMEIVDGGKDYAGGNPPATIQIGDKTIPNFRKDELAHTVLGAPQKAWLKDRLTGSTATWKIWGVTNAPMDQRTDAGNIPPELLKTKWMGKDDFGNFGNGDFSNAYAERAEIYNLIRDRKIAGFVTVSGDRHAFWAGYAAAKLPPAKFAPVGLSFVTGSVSAPGMGEAVEFYKDFPLRPLFVRKVEGAEPEHTCNLTIKRGVRAALEYAASGDIEKARALTNPDNAPHLAFVDMAGHGYSVVTAAPDSIETEFVCVVRPIARAKTPDGGPLRYRVSHKANLWKGGTAPKLAQRVIEGNPKLSI